MNDAGRIEKSFTPVLDGTLQGPDEILQLPTSYLRELENTDASKILFMAYRAKWIWQRERDHLLWNARAGRVDYAKARRAKLPMGSGMMETAIRCVVILRLKGASIFWAEKHAEQMLLLRTYHKSNRWEVLGYRAFATPLDTAAQFSPNQNAPGLGINLAS